MWSHCVVLYLRQVLFILYLTKLYQNNMVYIETLSREHQGFITALMPHSIITWLLNIVVWLILLLSLLWVWKQQFHWWWVFFAYYSIHDGFFTIVFPEMRVHRFVIWRSDEVKIECFSLRLIIDGILFLLLIWECSICYIVHLFSPKISVLLLAYSLFLGIIHTMSLVKAYWKE